MAGSILAGGGRPKPLLGDVVGWETAWEGAPWDIGSTATGWPLFEFVYDLNTGSMLEVRSLAAAADAAIPGASVLTDSDVEPITAWAYLRPEDAALDGSANAKFMTADGIFAVPSVFANQKGFDPESVAHQVPKLPDLDNWPPAGWNGFEKPAGGDASQSSPAVVQKSPLSTPVEDPVLYATKLIGTEGDDVIDGTTGNDFFNGLGGDDVLNGGPGDDAFHFMRGFGQDVVLGFAPGSAGDDIIEFRDGFTNFDELLAASLQVGPNVLIEVDDESGIALVDVALASLNQDDFRFV